MSRYIERAENMARLVDAGRYDALEISGNSAEDLDGVWRPLLYATGKEAAFQLGKSEDASLEVDWFTTFSPKNPDSIQQCIEQARENARMVRDQISEEMWLELNSFYLFMKSPESEALFQGQADAFYRRVIRFCVLFGGLINATVRHDDGWRFIQAGKFLERADKTTRILDMLAFEENPGKGKLTSALRSSSALSAFRSEARGDVTLDSVISFLLFSESFPRSVRFCIKELDNHLHAISATPAGTFSNEAERIAGGVLAQLNFTSMEGVNVVGTHHYLDELQGKFNEIGQGVFETYVLLPQELKSVNRVRVWQEQQQQQQ